MYNALGVIDKSKMVCFSDEVTKGGVFLSKIGHKQESFI